MDTHDTSHRGIDGASDGVDQAGWAAQPSEAEGGDGSTPQTTSEGPQAPVPPNEPAEAPTPQSPQPRGKQRSTLAGLMVVVVLIGLRFGIPALFGEATQPGGIVNATIDAEDFSDGPGEWPTTSQGTASATVSDGTYNILMQKRGDELHPFVYLPEESWGSMEVEASARPVGDARTAFGISCAMSDDMNPGQQFTSGTLYTFIVLPWRGQYSIIRAQDAAAPTVLEIGTISSQVISGSGPFELRATCSTTDGKSTDLALFVDSQQIATATDADGPGAFNGMGVIAFTADPNGEVRFDDTLMKRI